MQSNRSMGFGGFSAPAAGKTAGGKEWTPAMTRCFDNMNHAADKKKTTPGFNNRSSEPTSGGFGFGGIDFQEVLRKERERWASMPPVRKNFYKEHAHIQRMTDDQAAEIRAARNNISVSQLRTEKTSRKAAVAAPVSEAVAKPIYEFHHAFSDYDELMAAIAENGFTTPSPIQCQLWPIVLGGGDCIGIAQTGTGKTLAFLFPAFIHIDQQPIAREERDGPTCLILTPTRELALQIRQEVKKYHYRGIKSVCLYGGGSRVSQVDLLAAGVEIVIATPGRMNDLIASGVLHISSVSYLVLDEADRMLDMGFEPQIRAVLANMRPDRQTVLTSATWPPGVRELAMSYMTDPVLTVVGTLDLNACKSVEQRIVMVDEDDKRSQLLNFIYNLQPDDKCLVFMSKKAMIDDVVADLCAAGLRCESLHGGREQTAREQVLKDFKLGHCRLVVASDLASRGLDVADITHVLNFDLPQNMEEYVHRIGRTGRAGKSGQATTLVCRRDWRNAQQLIDILERNDQFVPEQLRRMAARWAYKQNELRARGPDAGGGSGSRGFGGGGGGGGFRPSHSGGSGAAAATAVAWSDGMGSFAQDTVRTLPPGRGGGIGRGRPG